MLLASSLTPSGRDWVLESALATYPDASVELLGESADVHVDAVLELITDSIAVQGAQFTGTELIAGIASFRDIAGLVAAWENDDAPNAERIVWSPRSVAEIGMDLQSLMLLAEAAGASPQALALVAQLRGLHEAWRSGGIEWLLGVPPQPAAMTQAALEVAAAVGSGLRVRGILVAPMPRKKDGWPKALRVQARDSAARLALDLHPVQVHRAKGGSAPAFDRHAVAAAEAATISEAGGEWVFTLTLSGLAAMDASEIRVGTWSADTAHPTTHVLVRIGHRSVRWPVEATLRRCRAVDAVVAGDTVAVTFAAEDGQWPERSTGAMDD